MRLNFQVQSLVAQAFRDTMQENGCLEIHSPKIVSGGTEGGAEVFKLSYFDRVASLAQSPQLYKQIAVGAFERVFEIGPVFRAEQSHTSRHLTEFTGLDFELAHIKSQHDVMDLQEAFIEKMLSSVKVNENLNETATDIEIPTYKAIPRITWEEATALVKKHNTELPDINYDKAIGAAVQLEFDSQFVFVYQYPENDKPFYIMPTTDKEGYTESFDLIYQGLEISSGGQRIHDPQLLRERMVMHGLIPEDNPGYLQAFDAGMPPHGGAGMGLERITQVILGLHNIREATLFPRDVKRLLP